MDTPRPAIAVMSRYPRAGLVKTRLMPLLGAEGCRRLQEALLLDTVWRLDGLDAPLFLYLDGADPRERTRLGTRLPPRLRIRSQRRGDLGRRMLHVCREVTRTEPGVIVIGTDAPTLPLDLVRIALERVAAGCCVICPVDDGGYCLLGLRHSQRRLFESIEWGTRRVLAQTLEQLGADGALVLEPWYDVDVEEDLHRLAADLRERKEGYPCRTAALLDQLGLAAVRPGGDDRNE